MDDGRHRGGAAFRPSGACGWAGGGGLAEGPMDGNGAAEAVKPLLLVEDVVDLQRVGLRLVWVLRTHTENILGCERNEKKKKQ